MIYIPGQSPSVATDVGSLILWMQTELERVSALSRVQEEDIAAAATTGGGSTGIWDLDELNASAVYTASTFILEEGAA